MLDMLLTSDAANKHGHEPASPTVNGSFLVQMPLSIIGSVLRRNTPPPPALVIEKHTNNAAVDAATSQNSAMIALPDTPLATPSASRPVSSASSTTAEDQPRKRASRSKTSYICARPPVRTAECITKLHWRPKVLLQLHQVIASQRPKPTYEVIPFSLLPPRSTRRLARTFNTEERLCPNDLLVVKAEDYGNVDEDAKTDDDWGSREVVGVISPAKGDKGVTEICMDDGASRWEVIHMPNGGFEFNTVDDHGLALKARWVPKPAHSRRASAMSASSQLSPTLPPGQDDKKYTFSTISAHSRRHPIIATMTRSRIDVMDSYTMPSATSPPTPASLVNLTTPALTPPTLEADCFFSTEPIPIHTDDALRRFILVTGVWVSSKVYCAPNTHQHALSQDPSATPRTLGGRAVSMSFLEHPRSVSPASTIEEGHRSFPKLLRTGINRLPRSTSFTEPSPSPTLTRTTSNASPIQKTRSRRANSTGTANLPSRSESMRQRYGIAFECQALVESEEERQVKRSVELLRIKELALPISERSSSDTCPPTPITSPAVVVIPSPIIVEPMSETIPAPLLSAPLLSPPLPDPERSQKTQSAFNPITTAGLWDSGVTERPGIRSRPTSMSVILEKQKKQNRKRERSKTKEDRKAEKDNVSLKKHGEWRKFKTSVKGLFKREKA
jgi:hypothetical protein